MSEALHPRRRPLRALTGLRFFAAMHVVAFHAAQPLVADSKSVLRELVMSGYVGVSLFFVLSGFILAYNYLGPLDQPPVVVDRRSFFVARFARVVPVYMLAAVMSAPLLLHAGSPLRTLGVALTTLLLLQAWIPGFELWNRPAWSLSDEAFFYATFPALSRVISPQKNRAIGWVAALWAVSLAAPIAYLLVDPDGIGAGDIRSEAPWLTFLKYAPIVRLPEFLIGMVLGRWYLSRTPQARSGAIAIVAALSIVAVLCVSSKIPYPLLHNGAMTPLFALLVFSLADERGPLSWLLALPITEALGEASYALYVLHVPIAMWMRKVNQRVHLLRPESAAYIAVYVVVAVAVSLLVLRVLEEPARKALRRFAKPATRA